MTEGPSRPAQEAGLHDCHGAWLAEDIVHARRIAGLAVLGKGVGGEGDDRQAA